MVVRNEGRAEEYRSTARLILTESQCTVRHDLQILPQGPGGNKQDKIMFRERNKARDQREETETRADLVIKE